MNLYRITNNRGATLCFQVGATEKEAVFSAREFYGHSGATIAEFVREA